MANLTNEQGTFIPPQQANGQAVVPVQPQLAFTPPPPQQPGSDLLGMLSAIAGLGLNIAGAATQTGAAGNGTLQFANSQLDQSAKNKQAQQKYENATKVGQSVYDQAKASNVPKAALGTIKSYAEAGDPDAAARELDRALSELRRKDAEARQDKFYALSEAQQGQQITELGIKQHPAALDAFLTGVADKLGDDDQAGNIKTRLAAEAKRQGITLDQKAVAGLTRELLAAKEAAKSSRKSGMLWWEKDVPKEEWKTPGQIFKDKNKDGIDDFLSLKERKTQYDQAVQLLRAKPNSPRYNQGVELLQQIQGGAPVVPPPGAGKTELKNPGIPAAEWDIIKTDPAAAQKLIQSMAKPPKK